MALTGKEHVRVTGTIKGGPAASTLTATTQDIANLRNGGSTPLNGKEPVSIRGPAGHGGMSQVAFNTTAHLIGAIGSIAPSVLTGLEVLLLDPQVTGGAPSALPQQVTTLQIANS